MIVTVTPNTAVDHILFVPCFAEERTLRASKVLQSMAGKPTDVSWMLGKLQIPSTALGFGAGDVGKKIRDMLLSRGVTVDFTSVEGESRRNIVIVNEQNGHQTTITDRSLRVTDRHVLALRRRYEALLPQASCVVLGGTLPEGVAADFYAGLIHAAHAAGVPTLFDASGVYLEAGLQARPTYIKPNQPELSTLMGRPVVTLEDAAAAGKQLLAQTGTQSIITLGALGGLAVLKDRVVRIPALAVDVVNAAGAGDGVLAGLAASVSERKPIDEGLRLGFALANATLLHPMTAEFECADLDSLLPQIRIIDYQ